jgi:L-amino acid N-acyltransferase YncA
MSAASEGGLIIKQLTPNDWDDVKAIFMEAIRAGNSSFETQPAASFEAWMDEKYPSCCIIARDGESGQALAWAALTSASKRFVFRGVAELSLYVTFSAHGRGIGRRMMEEVLRLSEEANIWTIQSAIFPENEVSINLHNKFGFRLVGTREKIGKMLVGPHAGKWRDLVFMERRSTVAGTD